MEEKINYKEFWKNLKKEIRDDLNSRGLSDSSIRINALESVEGLIRYSLKTMYENPNLLMKVEKKELKRRLAMAKKNKSINDAESSVINDMYRFFEAYEKEKTSQKT